MHLFVLNNFNLSDVLHVGIDSDPKNGIVFQFSRREDVLGLLREVFKLEFVHFELPYVVVQYHLGRLHVNVSPGRLEVLVFSEREEVELFLLGRHGPLDSALQRDVRTHARLEFFELHFVLLLEDVATAALDLVNDNVDVPNKPPPLGLHLVHVKRIQS